MCAHSVFESAFVYLVGLEESTSGRDDTETSRLTIGYLVSNLALRVP